MFKSASRALPWALIVMVALIVYDRTRLEGMAAVVPTATVEASAPPVLRPEVAAVALLPRATRPKPRDLPVPAPVVLASIDPLAGAEFAAAPAPAVAPLGAAPEASPLVAAKGEPDPNAGAEGLLVAALTPAQSGFANDGPPDVAPLPAAPDTALVSTQKARPDPNASAAEQLVVASLTPSAATDAPLPKVAPLAAAPVPAAPISGLPGRPDPNAAPAEQLVAALTPPRAVVGAAASDAPPASVAPLATVPVPGAVSPIAGRPDPNDAPPLVMAALDPGAIGGPSPVTLPGAVGSSAAARPGPLARPDDRVPAPAAFSPTVPSPAAERARLVAFLDTLEARGAPPEPAPAEFLADKVEVDKAARRLRLIHDGRVIREYVIALGAAPYGHKREEGDERTPEGNYFIDWRNPYSVAHLSLHISYPNAEDRARARAEGVDPGGDIMIHGLLNGWGWLGRLHALRDWTNGCIAVTNIEMRQIWALVPNGTPITIR